MKHNTLLSAATIRHTIGTALVMLAGINAGAQCTTPVLDVSTGYDPIAASIVVPSNTQPDPMWTSSVSPDAAAAITAMGDVAGCYDALPCGAWPSAIPGSTWVMSQNDWGYFTDGVATSDFYSTFTRTFTVCGQDSVNYVVDSTISDDWISDISVDGTSIQTYPAVGYIHYYNGAIYHLGMLTGTHTITYTVHNLNNGIYKNAIGLDVRAHLVSATGSASLVSETCPGYTCEEPDECDEKCFWRLTGNHIAPGRNILGTLTKDDIRIFTSNVQRGVVKAGGEFGIHVPGPSTTLDVNCVPPGGAPSGLRFENLPYGQGMPLVVDGAGYVYIQKGGVTGGNPSSKQLQQQVDELKQQIEELRVQLGVRQAAGTDGATLTVSPNPSDGDIHVTYAIPSSFSKAVIRITDNQGRIIIAHPVEGNNGILHLTLPLSVKSSTLFVSLMVDGNVTSAKQLSYLAK